ncbi:ATP-binding response regulator [Sphingobacterium suaedae]|uniref:histidine kinase n=1 Tax=Sphingobacterium suaedae TaxID=1686402 RepID=A0ABW5KNK9_9SPHI
MLKNNKKTFLLRKVLIGALVVLFAYLSTVFIYQYLTYQKVKEQLNAAYASAHSQSSALYRLFSTFGEADNLFRLYTIDFSKPAYSDYKTKLDTIKYYVDSLSSLPIENNPLHQSTAAIDEKDNIASEFASLKKTVDDLVFLAQDSLPVLTTSQRPPTVHPQYLGADSVLNKILSDTLLNQVALDTVVRKKQSLFKRIFNAKNDTVVANSTTQQLNVNQIDVVHRNIEQIIIHNERIFHTNLRNLQRKFTTLRQKERELIQANYRLLNNLKTGIDKLKEREQAAIQRAEERDLALYKENARQFGDQLIAALAIMFLMILFILFYQANAATYERKLQEEKEYAAKVAEEKTSVLANISHEVRAPINSLMGIIDILKKNDDTGLINTEYLDSVAHEISVINSSVTDILNLSKLEVGALTVKYEYFSPKHVLEDIIGLHTYHAQKKGILLQQHIQIDPKTEVFSSAFRIKQIVSNLISNAIKYTPKGSVNLTASIKNIQGQQHLQIEVSDTGLGIAPEHQKHIFRQYYMTDNTSKAGGFGLGLYISKLLTEQLEGEISLTSTLGKGSTFTLSIPIRKQRDEKQEPKRYALTDLPNSLRLVLIDDNRINILYLKHYFKDFPNVYAFEDGLHALEFIRSNDVDVVITDLLMPDISGWDMLQAIRSDSRLRAIPVFVITADDMQLETNQLGENNMQFDAILAKPLNEQEFVSNILHHTKEQRF